MGDVAGTCRVHLLGGFRVEVDGRAVPDQLWRHRGQDVIKILALTPGYHVPRLEVVMDLWPGLPDRQSSDLLHKALKEVRKALGSDLAVTEEGSFLRFWPQGSLWVDLHVFISTAKHARLPEQREAARDLYAGNLLPEDPNAPWAEARRALARQAFEQLLPREPDEAPRVIDLREALVTHPAP